MMYIYTTSQFYFISFRLNKCVLQVIIWMSSSINRRRFSGFTLLFQGIQDFILLRGSRTIWNFNHSTFKFYFIHWNWVSASNSHFIIPIFCKPNLWTQDISNYEFCCAMIDLYQGCNSRKVNCGRVYSAYTLKPVLFGRNL